MPAASDLFRLVDSGWAGVLATAARAGAGEWLIICPFLKLAAVEALLACRPHPRTPLRVVTRFNLADMAEGVTDTAALRLLLNRGAQIRGLKGLHAKVYVFGSHRAVVTSANLTQAALHRNAEFGFVAGEQGIVQECRAYFERLWASCGPDLDAVRLATWDRQIDEARLHWVAQPFGTLPDEGAAPVVPTDFPADIHAIRSTDDSGAHVKFFGEGTSRAPLTMPVIREVLNSLSHWACCYPASKRPRAVKTGDAIYMGRLTGKPSDIRVIGRATGLAHVPGRDEATPGDVAIRGWKTQWSNYIRVHSAQYVAGTLANGVSLSEMMDALGSESFEPTARNAARGSGNVNPRRAFLQQAAVELTTMARQWLDERLEAAFARHGMIPPEMLARLPGPRFD